MNVDCFYCLRYFLMFIIFLNMILGLTMLTGSLWAFLHGARMGNVFADTEGFNYVLYFLMALGAVKFLLGFLGCCSVNKKNSRMLATFFALMLTVFLGQIAAGVWLYIDEDQVTDRAKDSLAKFIEIDYGTPEYLRKTTALDFMQSKFKCCGSNGPNDWQVSAFNGGNGTLGGEEYLVPASCCISNETDVCEVARRVPTVILEGSVYQEGCVQMLLQQIFDYGAIIWGVIGGVILIELFVMTSTIILCRSKNVRYKL
ncbi:tetraspanin-5-like [Macrobrachium nipponense]|uniref:tetraspanin-5-like n=1 Tax=Macrobrachium nipponense TaxID=159736 RepID=UPI0030C7CB4A